MQVERQKIHAPRMTLVIPIRCRLQFTTNILPTALQNASRDHEVIIVVDECSIGYDLERRGNVKGLVDAARDDELDRTRVLTWLKEHRSLLQAHGVKVVYSYGDRRCWTGGLRSSAALNVGVEEATTEWIVGIGDEDLCFRPDWDVDLWRVLIGYDPMKTVSTLTMVMPNVWPSWELTPAWIHASRSRACHQLSFPIKEEHSDIGKARISEAAWDAYANKARLPGVIDEPCGARQMCHWVPMLMYKPLLMDVGMWPIDDACASSYDIELDNRLAARGVQKRMAQDALVLHAKHYLYMGHNADEAWGEKGVIESLRGVEIL